MTSPSPGPQVKFPIQGSILLITAAVKPDSRKVSTDCGSSSHTARDVESGGCCALGFPSFARPGKLRQISGRLNSRGPPDWRRRFLGCGAGEAGISFDVGIGKSQIVPKHTANFLENPGDLWVWMWTHSGTGGLKRRTIFEPSIFAPAAILIALTSAPGPYSGH